MEKMHYKMYVPISHNCRTCNMPINMLYYFRLNTKHISVFNCTFYSFVCICRNVQNLTNPYGIRLTRVLGEMCQFFGFQEVKMRLDKFLKVSRLIKRRTVANEACDAGRVLVNGNVAKASVKVKPGDIIEIQFGMKNVKVEVVEIQDTTKKEEAKDLFRYL